MKKIQNAIISVSNKVGLLPFVKQLLSLEINIYSTGGTKKYLLENGLQINDIQELTDFPEILDGRVKTLHPHVHAGILAKRDTAEHRQVLVEKKIIPIDLVVVNLYPFAEIIAKEETKLAEAIENIDIGGPTLLRSAAKNYRDVLVICQPQQYPIVSQFLSNALTSPQSNDDSLREKLAATAFHHVAEYDTTIDKYLQYTLMHREVRWQYYPTSISLRYGENPHQSAKLYRENLPPEQDLSAAESFPKNIDIRPKVVDAEILQGKEMSYNNYLDADAALESLMALQSLLNVRNEDKKVSSPAKVNVVIIKHSNPCGISTGSNTLNALQQAWEGDITSAFGSVIATNGAIDLTTAKYFSDKFIEILIAPNFTIEVLDYFKKKSQNIRLLQLPALKDSLKKNKLPNFHLRYLTGGLLIQENDEKLWQKFAVVSQKQPLPKAKSYYCFAYAVVKRLKSNAIAIVHEYTAGCFMLLGMGTGQPNRVESLKIALMKAEENVTRLFGKEQIPAIMGKTILASDAFFPFADNIEHANKHYIKHIIQPGGSIRDKEVIAACDRYGISLVFAGTRHFLH